VFGQFGNRWRDALRHQLLRGIQQRLAHAGAWPVRRFAAGRGLPAGGCDQAGSRARSGGGFGRG
jgi:hypothetical protein